MQEHARADAGDAGAADSRPKMLVHMDLYRLNGEDDVVAIGWEDYLARGAVLAVEWPERAGCLVPPGARHVRFRHLGEESRMVAIDTATDVVV